MPHSGILRIHCRVSHKLFHSHFPSTLITFPTVLLFLLESNTELSETSTWSYVTMAIKMLSSFTSWNSKCIFRNVPLTALEPMEMLRGVWSHVHTSKYRRVQFWVPAARGVEKRRAWFQSKRAWIPLAWNTHSTTFFLSLFLDKVSFV